MYKHFKRLFDLLFAIILFLCTLPIAIVVGILVAGQMGSPIFFRQKRIGLNGKPFYIVKFRSMRNKSDKYVTDQQRVTKLGTLLRKTSFDEIPQLLNIIAGDMSFIGPRPLLEQYVEYYNEHELKRLNVRPGMSGYAEVIGRHELTWEEQFEYDVQYVEKFSFATDLSIFLKTIPKVLISSKVSAVGRKNKDGFHIHRQKQLGLLPKD